MVPTRRSRAAVQSATGEVSVAACSEDFRGRRRTPRSASRPSSGISRCLRAVGSTSIRWVRTVFKGKFNVEVNGWITTGDRKDEGCSATPSRPLPTWADRAGVPLEMESPEGRRCEGDVSCGRSAHGHLASSTETMGPTSRGGLEQRGASGGGRRGSRSPITGSGGKPGRNSRGALRRRHNAA